MSSIETVTHCACGSIAFSCQIMSRSISDWIAAIHLSIQSVTGSSKQIMPGKYGYDVNAHVQSALLRYIEHTIKSQGSSSIFSIGLSDRQMMLDIIHNAWRNNYMYWINQRPYESNVCPRLRRVHAGEYKKPSKQLDTPRYHLLCSRYPSNLPSETIHLYNAIIDSTLACVKDWIVIQGLEAMQIK